MRCSLLALVVACAPSDGPPTSPPPAEVAPPATPPPAPPAGAPERPAAPSIAPPKTPAEFAAQALPLYCARDIRCGTLADSERESCLRDDGLRDRLLGFDRGLRAGRYSFDPELAAACLRLLTEASCQPDHATSLPGCLTGVVPSGLRPAVYPGGVCERSEECVDGRCTGELGCPGTCRALQPDLDGPCDKMLCVDGLFCDRGTCRVRGAVGESCGGHWQACAAGLICQGYVPPSHGYGISERRGTCEKPRGVGEPCSALSGGDDCEADLFCDFAADRPTCRERLPEGTACPWHDACADGLACDGFVSAPHRPGVCRTFGDHGSPCDPHASSTLCPSSTRCTPAGTCIRRGGDGDACRVQDDCRPYHYCNAKRRACVRQGEPGDLCRPGGTELDGPCFLGECVRGRCRARCSRGK